jgi:hypothetical protein
VVKCWLCFKISLLSRRECNILGLMAIILLAFWQVAFFLLHMEQFSVKLEIRGREQRQAGAGCTYQKKTLEESDIFLPGKNSPSPVAVLERSGSALSGLYDGLYK